ncbi:MAG TPA: glycosyltransferase [Anaerolineales bacterium]|nr:glycosyltransferase [Anaerolineales bacterium]
MRILIAGEAYYPSINGQAIFTINLAEGLARSGHKVLVVTSSEKGPAYHSRRNSVQIFALRSMALNYLHPDVFFSPFPGPAVGRAFEVFHPDMVHIQDHYPISRAVVKAARKVDLKVVGTNHFMPENVAPYFPLLSDFKSGFDRVMWAWPLGLYNQLDVVTAPSETAAAIMRRHGLQPAVYPISCGISLERFQPKLQADRHALRQRFGLEQNKISFLYIGRVDAEKRLEVLIQAVHQLKRQDIHLVIAGKGADRHRLAALASQLGIEQQVRFLGFVPEADKADLLNSADVFAMPSEAELLSIATLEAMACGRPVLAARSQALPELVDQGVNGYLFKPGDAGDAARKMALLAEHPERWERMGAASLEKAQRHSLEATVHKYENIYQDLRSEAVRPEANAGARPSKTKNARHHQPVDHLMG